MPDKRVSEVHIYKRKINSARDRERERAKFNSPAILLNLTLGAGETKKE